MGRWVFIFLLVVGTSQADQFKNFAELSSAMNEGRDYRIYVGDLQSDISVIAPHGGNIEPPTGELARELSRRTGWNFYVFEGRTDRPWDLHLTSSHFDEPSALDLASRSKSCVSLHGYKEAKRPEVCIGGLDTGHAALLATRLRRALPTVAVQFPCPRLPGVHPQNIVNRCGEGKGVQIEMSASYRTLLFHDVAVTDAFLRTIQEVFTDRLERNVL